MIESSDTNASIMICVGLNIEVSGHPRQGSRPCTYRYVNRMCTNTHLRVATTVRRSAVFSGGARQGREPAAGRAPTQAKCLGLLRQHSIFGFEVMPGVGSELHVAGMIDGLHTDDGVHQFGITLTYLFSGGGWDDPGATPIFRRRSR